MSEPFGQLPDPELIEACLNGKSQAWEALLKRYQRLIYTIPLRYGMAESDAGDVFQSVSLLLLENLARLRDRQRLGAWLVITTRRECWRFMRQSRQVAASLEQVPMEEQAAGSQPVAPHPEEDLLLLERQSLVHSAVDQLGQPCRELLSLLFYAEPRPPYADIAHRLNIPEGSIGPSRLRCLGKLSKILEKMGFDGKG